MKYYAHSKENEPPERWQLLAEHLKNVSDLSGQFADFFKSDSWGEITGKNHDIGKGIEEWQA